jgi:thioesterase domain-containing protein
MNELLVALQQTLIQNVPITKHMGISAERYDEKGLVLKAPLAGNTNPRGTAFAGSINSLITLTGWGTVWLLLQELNIDGYVVIQNSQTNYLNPITADFAAFCRKPAQDTIDKFKQALRKKGQARIELGIEIRQEDEVAVEFKGRYVVRLANPIHY